MPRAPRVPPVLVSAALLVLTGRARTEQEDRPSAHDVLRKAIRAQGKLETGSIRDIKLEFHGHVHDPDQGVHTAERTYWYRAADRSFRIRTRSKADARIESDRGVLKERGYWERLPDRILELSRLHRDDRTSIRAIEQDREDFERILRMVMLTRLEEDGTEVSYAAKEPVTLVTDRPYEARSILGDEGARASLHYHVLQLHREGSPTLRAYVRTDDWTVRKVVQLAPGRDGVPPPVEYVYYFGPFKRFGGLLLPRYFTVHTKTPDDEASMRESNRVRGRLSIEINTNLDDGDLRPRE